MSEADRSRPRPALRWPMTLAIVLTLAASLGALTSVFIEASWWFVMLGTIVIVMFSMTITRAVARWAFLVPIVGFVVLVVSLTFSFAPAQSIAGFIPTFGVIDQFTALYYAGLASIAAQGIPAEATAGIIFILAAAVGLLSIGLDFIAFTIKRPALIGAPLLVILAVPTVLNQGLVDPFYFFLTAAGYLLILYLSIGESRVGGAVGVGAAAIALALIVPLVLPPTVPPEVNAKPGPGFTMGINAFINLGDNLRRPIITNVLSYESTSGEGQYLRVSSIDTFNGSTWKPAEPTEHPGLVLARIGPTPGLAKDVDVESAITSVSIINLGGHWLPAPYAPTLVEGMGDGWSWDPDDLTITTTSMTARGATYDVTSELPTPSVQRLRAAGTEVPQGLDKYLALPEGLAPIVGETATTIAGSLPTNFDKAMALQKYFADGDFTYSQDAPVDEDFDGAGAGVIAKFLEVKKGYCVHFASAMAVMARQLGIPSRISVGFTPGEHVAADESGPDHYLVTTANLHAWPELYFNEIGWIRFEPTVSRGEQPNFQDENSPSNPTDSPTDSPTSTPTATSGPQRTDIAQPTDSALDESDSASANAVIPRVTISVLALAAIIVLLLPLIPILVRTTRRLIRYAKVMRRGSATAAWQELGDTAVDLGWTSSTMTPREFAALVRPGMGTRALDAMERLLAAVEATAYSPAPSKAVLSDLRLVRAGMRSVSSRNDRMRARFAPRSVGSLRRRRSAAPA